MNKREFFIHAMNAGRFQDKRWLMAAFSVVEPKVDVMADMKPWDILYVDGNNATRKVAENTRVVFIDDKGEMIELSDYEYNPKDAAPPYAFQERVTVTKEEMTNLKKKEVETCYGNLVANWLLCVYPFGTKIDFIEGRFGVKDVEKHIDQRMEDEPPEGQARDPEKIYVDEYFKYRRAASMIDGLTQLCVPSATAKSMTRHPDTEKVRKELLEKYEGRLHDPVVISKIEKELGKLDMEWLEGDKSMGFYIKAKSLDVVRKKAHLMMGLESGFGDGNEATLIEGALAEGWKAEDLPAMISNLREGTYDRGRVDRSGWGSGEVHSAGDAEHRDRRGRLQDQVGHAGEDHQGHARAVRRQLPDRGHQAGATDAGERRGLSEQGGGHAQSVVLPHRALQLLRHVHRRALRRPRHGLADRGLQRGLDHDGRVHERDARQGSEDRQVRLQSRAHVRGFGR